MEPQNTWNAYNFKVYIENVILNVWQRLCKVEFSFLFIEIYVANILQSSFYLFCIGWRWPCRPKYIVMNTSSVDNKTLVLVGRYWLFGKIYFFCLQGGV